MRRIGLAKRSDVLRWDYEHMCRRLRIDVAKDDDVIRARNDRSRNFSAHDFAEKTILAHLSPIARAIARAAMPAVSNRRIEDPIRTGVNPPSIIWSRSSSASPPSGPSAMTIGNPF